MATVPEYRRQIKNRPVNQQGVQVRTSPDTFGAGIGRATGAVADGLFKVADAIDFKDQLTQDADARKAFDAYRYDQREAMRAPEEGYLNRKGANGVNVQKPAEQRLRELREVHGKGLSARARKKYDGFVDGMQDQAHGQLLTHTSNETRNYITNQRKSTVEGYLEEAATNWNDAGLYEKNLGLALKEQGELANLEGWDPATKSQAAEKLVSSATKQRIIQAAAVDPMAAKDLLDNSRDRLNAGDEYALDTNLKGLVVKAQADKFVQGFVTQGSTPGGAGDPYAQSVIQAESGGNPNAANNPNNPGFASADGRYSSALGLHQYLRGTYLGVVRDMRSEGAAAWAGGMSDNEIAATRTDPRLEGSVHAYARNQNAARIQAAGFPVTKATEYAFHHFGTGGGADLLRAAKHNPTMSSAEALGAAALKSNPQFKNKTAAEVLDIITGYVGGDGASASGDQAYFDAGAAMQAAMAIEDPDVRDAAMQKINSLRVMQNNAKADQREGAQEDAWKQYTESGVTDFGYEMKQAMGQGGWTAFQNAVSNDQQGIDQTDPKTWDMLTSASSDPAEFAKINLEAHRASLSKSDWRDFYNRREAAKDQIKTGEIAVAKDKAELPYAKLVGYTDDIYRGQVDNTSEAKMTQDQLNDRMDFQRQMQQLIGEFFDRETRAPSQIEVQDMALALTLPVTTSGRSSKSSKWGNRTNMFGMANRPNTVDFDVSLAYKDVPYADKARIATQLSALGHEPTQDAIANAYENETLMNAGIPPKVTIAEVPKDMIEEIKADLPNATETDILEIYQSILLTEYQESGN